MNEEDIKLPDLIKIITENAEPKDPEYIQLEKLLELIKDV